MVPPKVKVNSFIKKENGSDVDPISKLFMKIEAIFGLNRIAVLDECSFFQKAFIAFYTVLVHVAVIVTVFFAPVNKVIFTDLANYCFVTIFSFLTYKRLKRYLSEISNFDKQVGIKPITTEFIKTNTILHGIFVLVMISIIFVHANKERLRLPLLPVRMIHIFELYFYGHLFSLIYPRIRLINCYMESSLTDQDIGTSIKAIGYSYVPSEDHLLQSKCLIKFLMDLYQMLIEAHTCLIDAIKWQFVVVLTTSFLSSLFFSYDMALKILGPDNALSFWDYATNLPMPFGMSFSLFAPCIYGDQLYGQVRRLRMLLASRLYENKMEKCERGVARALLGLTEEHNLSITMLGMITVDISLPLKFISLLVTYLIIMLQFQKILRT